MPLKKLARHAREAGEVGRDLLLGRYPDFVTGGPLPKGHVPVFVFHSLEPRDFGRKLAYLADNRYVTLGATEYFQVLMGTRPAPEKAVVLTFDDGRGSVRSVGWPLMKRYGFKGIVFLVPGRIASRPDPLPPTLDTAPRREVLAREDHEPFLTWEEVAELSRTGSLDFESHTLTHARVHTAPHPAGFLTPALQRGYSAMDVPWLRDGERDLLAAEAPLGTPLFRSAPRTSESPRFFEDESLRRACVEAAAAEGPGFFTRRDWEQSLRRLLGRGPFPGRLESFEEREAAIQRELVESKRLIEERTGRPVKHLCYPWHVSGPTARRLAQQAGYRTAFCGKVRGVPLTLPGGDPLAIARVGEDYLERLPGRGRSTLAAVLRQKWARRLAGG